MPAFNFRKKFAEKVERGEKFQTIRKRRKDGRNPKAGQTAYLYFGMRTKACRKLGEGVITSAEPIYIDRNGLFIDIVVGANYLGHYEKVELSRADGFKSFHEMMQWFEKTHGLPFYGFLIKWNGPTERDR